MRIKGLDYLRGIAILGVMCRHSDMHNVFVAIGGYGVDLFFVLSGFLVAGLLFSEYQKRGAPRIKRFLIRRAFKIYPAFYIYLLLSILLDIYFFGKEVRGRSILVEAFFVQSYGWGLQQHTWSLAVEEHFYLFIAFAVFIAVRKQWLSKGDDVITALCGLILFVLSMRLTRFLPHMGEPIQPFFETHLRADGLLTGTLLAYIWHFRYDLVEKFYRYKLFFFGMAMLMILPAFFLSPNSFFMSTIGFNLTHAAFAFFILLLCDPKRESVLFRNPYVDKISSVICFIGINSYSIYLWHLVVKEGTDKYFTSVFPNTLVFFCGAIAVGVLSTVLIEKTFLRIRDRHFPSLA